MNPFSYPSMNKALNKPVILAWLHKTDILIFLTTSKGKSLHICQADSPSKTKLRYEQIPHSHSGITRAWSGCATLAVTPLERLVGKRFSEDHSSCTLVWRLKPSRNLWPDFINTQWSCWSSITLRQYCCLVSGDAGRKWRGFVYCSRSRNLIWTFGHIPKPNWTLNKLVLSLNQKVVVSTLMHPLCINLSYEDQRKENLEGNSAQNGLGSNVLCYATVMLPVYCLSLSSGESPRCRETTKQVSLQWHLGGTVVPVCCCRNLSFQILSWLHANLFLSLSVHFDALHWLSWYTWRRAVFRGCSWCEFLTLMHIRWGFNVWPHLSVMQ